MDNAVRNPLLKVENLCVAFRRPRSGETFRALDGIDLLVHERETIGLVGESGSGKTTLGRAILRLVPTQHGAVHFQGTDISHYSERQLRPLRPNMQMIFQDPASSFNPRQSIGVALRVALSHEKRCSPAQIDARIDTLLGRVGLSAAFKSRLPHELSGGQLQRIAIARVLALAPKLVIADEAVSKLDVSVRSGVLNLLRDIQDQEGLSCIFITHDLEVARYLSHTVVVLYHGKVLEQGAAEDVFQNPRHPYTQTLIGKGFQGRDSPAATATAAEWTDGLPGAGCRYAPMCPHAMDQCRSKAPGLEQVGKHVGKVSRNHTVACWRIAALCA